MKNTLIALLAVLAVPALAQVKSSVIKNTADTEVFSIGYGSGVATVTVAGVVSATELVANSTNLYAGQDNVTVNSNLTVRGATTLNTLSATGAVTASSTLSVRGATTLDNVTSTGTLAVAETALVSGNTTLNGTLTLRTNMFTVSATGVGVFADDVTMDKPIFTDANTDAAPTNSASGGFVITVNGTNYWLALYPVND